MKRWLFLIAGMLLLAGCSAEPDATVSTSDPPEVPAQFTTEPTGYYDPNSAMEASTDGAVRVYPLNRTDSYGLVPMGNDLLLLSGDEVTTLTKLTGSSLYVAAAANLDCYIDGDSPAFQASEKGVTYYDGLHRELVFLDSELKEVQRLSLPGTILGDPALAADRKTLYYCTANALRAIDLETGLDKLLKEMFFPSQTLSALHCNDSILECSVIDSYGNDHDLFIRTENGETVWESFDDLSLQTRGDTYFAVHSDGAYQEFLTGSAGTEPSLLLSDTYGVSAEPVLEMNGAVVLDISDDTTGLSFYDLETGLRSYALELPHDWYPQEILGNAEADCIWFLRYDEEYTSDILCRWELNKTATGDETVSLTQRYTAHHPDMAGLSACQETAAALSEKHGVEILLWTSATACQPEDYFLQGEYQVPLIARYLKQLDQILSCYPSGFLKEAASGTSCGRIKICLVRSITGSADADVPESTDGIQYWDSNGNTYVAAALGTGLEQAICHELFHIIDSRVISTCSAYDNWETLNPKGFAYTYSHTVQPENASGLLEGENRAFIDLYAMSYPKEDRARIMEYAMMPGSEAYFDSETMQLKLRRLCLGIREAFNLEETTEPLLWEQYLILFLD